MGQGTDVVGNRGQMSRGQRDADNLARQDTGTDTGADATPDTAAIRGDIERTRAEMAQTIDALQDKLDPQVVAGQVKAKVRAGARDRVTQATQSMRTGVIERVQRVQAKVGDTAASLSQRTGASTGASTGVPTGASTNGDLSGTVRQWLTLGQRQALQAVERMRRLSEEDPGAYTALLVIGGIAVIGLVWIARSSND